MAERDPIWRLRFLGRLAKRRIDHALHGARDLPRPPVASASWRRPFWNAASISAYGAAFEALDSRPAEMATAPNLVLALARGYRTEQLAPFVLSLRAAGYRDQIVFLVSDLAPDTEAFLREHGVDLIAFDADTYAPYHCQNARYFMYLDYLLLRLRDGALPANVFLTDVRDVIFQADPFAFARAELDVFYENEAVPIGACKYNARWIYQCFGDESLKELAARPICCSGTSVMTGKGALNYLIAMWNIMTLLSDAAARGVSDQAAHNLIVHRGLVDGTRAHANGDHVLTLHHVGEARLRIASDGAIVGESGAVCAIVHQYDRHPQIGAAVLRRYAPGARVVEPA